MTIDQLTFGVVIVIFAAAVALVLMAVRQGRQTRRISVEVAGHRDKCARLESRLETIDTNCQFEFSGIKGRLNKLEVGS